jgi:hypothetical protein
MGQHFSFLSNQIKSNQEVVGWVERNEQRELRETHLFIHQTPGNKLDLLKGWWVLA